MSVPAVGQSSAIHQAAGSIARPSAQQTDSNFSKLFSELIQDVNSEHVQADESLKQLVSGKTEDVHDVVLSVAQADLALRLVVEIRNRLIDSYQEIMRMQI